MSAEPPPGLMQPRLGGHLSMQIVQARHRCWRCRVPLLGRWHLMRWARRNMPAALPVPGWAFPACDECRPCCACGGIHIGAEDG